MGREWYWGGRSSKRGGAGKGGDYRDSTSTASSSFSSSSGCMSAVFQFFDLHHFQLPLIHQQSSYKNGSFLPEEPTIPKGSEAPRNSLKSEGSSLSSIIEEEENLNIPMGIQIKTSRRSTCSSKAGASNDLSSETSSSSPGAKTPSLVARLMGLDLLPETSSPSFSSNSSNTTPNPHSKSQILQPPKTKQTIRNKAKYLLDSDSSGTRSLPETPRISSARRSDVDHHHRLSLQINKENVGEDLDLSSRLSILRRKEVRVEEESRSPGHYARQIVKQVKENVSRKVGMDITNTIRNRDQVRDELVNQIKSKKVSKGLAKLDEEATRSKQSSRIKTSKPNSTTTKDQTFQGSKPISSTVNVSTKTKEQKQKSHVSIQKGGKMQEETFVRSSPTTRSNIPDKKCKKTPLSNNLLNLNVPTLLPLKKCPTSPPPTKIPHNKQLSSSESQKYEPEARITDAHKPNGATSTTTTTGCGVSEIHHYITTILALTGITKITKVSFTKWFSPSHPLDPSIFHLQENSIWFSNQLRLRCDRKLLFDVVDEILVDILKPYLNLKPWIITTCRSDCCNSFIQGSELIEELCFRIQRFPGKNCQVLEDIDSLVDEDLPALKDQNAVSFKEEGEGLVMEIEKELLDTLVHETALILRDGN
ncbi:hypothetical protein UlMin_024348 [Ulmus minor]